jgi:hypothetical protein
VISILEWEFINTNIDINTDKKNSSAFAREKIDTDSIAKTQFFFLETILPSKSECKTLPIK